VTRLLDKDEKTRMGSKSGASEVKQHKWFAKINWGLLRNTQPPVSRFGHMNGDQSRGRHKGIFFDWGFFRRFRMNLTIELTVR
jgi:protein-serine/threonine kinase